MTPIIAHDRLHDIVHNGFILHKEVDDLTSINHDSNAQLILWGEVNEERPFAHAYPLYAPPIDSKPMNLSIRCFAVPIVAHVRTIR